VLHQKSLVVVPAFNEARSIGSVVTNVQNYGYELLVVDDGSSDNTAEICEQLGARVLRLPLNLGVGGALRAAFRLAVDEGYSSIVQVDADGQHPVHQIRNLLEAADLHDAHLVIGSRYMNHQYSFKQSRLRRLAMLLMGWLVSREVGRRITDSTSGFRIIREPLLTEFAREFPSYYLGDTYEATISAARAGYRIMEIPADLQPRQHGASSASNPRAIALIAKVLLISTFRLHTGH
jgi:glycosyltransferase involved in cell wall biosynthesis